MTVAFVARTGGNFTKRFLWIIRQSAVRPKHLWQILLYLVLAASTRAGDRGGLVATLKHARGARDRITVDFVLKNTTSRPVVIAGRDNSWGGYQWTFTLTDSAGTKLLFGNPMLSWRGNYLRVTTIAPGQELALPCVLRSSSLGKIPLKEESFCPIESGSRFPNHYLLLPRVSWKYPVKLVGEFRARSRQKQWKVRTNWKGSVQTEEVTVAAK